MKDSLFIAISEIKKYLRDPFKILAIIVILLIPLIYGFLYLWAFWDPYGNVKNLPIAVVNQDLGYIYNGDYRNLGDELIDEMKNKDFNFYFINYDEAMSGLYNKKYYGIIIIPKDFTKNVFSIKEEPVKAEIFFEKRDVNNFLGSRISFEIVKELNNSLKEKIRDKYVDEIIPISESLLNNMSEASDVSTDLSNGIKKLKSGSNLLKEGSNQLSEGIEDISFYLNKVKDGSEKLAEANKRLYEGSKQFSSNIDELSVLISSLADKGVIDPSYKLKMEFLKKQNSVFVNAHNEVYLSSYKLSENLEKIYEGSQKLREGSRKLERGISTLENGIKLSYYGSNELSSELAKASDNLKKDFSEQKIREKSEMLFNPVIVIDVSKDNAETYGEALSPYFILLALWVGALIIMIFVNQRDNSLIISKFSDFSITLGKSIFPAILALLQALILDFSLILFIGLQPKNILLFLIYTVFLSWTFLAIIQFVMVLFGKIGQIIAIILLMLQLTSGAGTFPIETSPGFFQFISPFMPMTHGISLLRDLILLNELNLMFLVKETLIIFFFFLLFFFARLLITRKKLKISDIIPLINF